MLLKTAGPITGLALCASLAVAQSVSIPPSATIPFYDIFPTTVPEEAINLTVTFDPDVTIGDASTSSPFAPDNNENDEPFGSLFLTSPNQAAMSDLSESSDWVLTDCNATSLDAQTVVAFCSTSTASSQCAHVFTGGAQHTVVKMPQGCGKGPLARVVSLEVHPSPSTLSPVQLAGKPASEPVFALQFDYDFAAIPEDNGPIYMRADASDIPGYWDGIVDNPIVERRSSAKFQRRGLWDSVTSWFNQITTITKSNSASRTFSWSDTFQLFSVSKACPGPPAINASLTASVSGTAQFATTYGFYFQGTLVPPAVNTAYVYLNGNALAKASFTLQGKATVTYDSTMVQMLNVGFPGLSVPGIITIGPSFNLVGYITGFITLDGSITTGVTYQFPPVSFALGPGSGIQSTGVQPSNTPSNNFQQSFNADVSISANAALHIVPSVQLGISVLGGKLINANGYVQADLFAGIGLNSSVSTTTPLQFCVNPYYGVTLSAGVQGSVIFWSGTPLSYTYYQARINSTTQCFNPTLSKRDELLTIDEGSAFPHEKRGLVDYDLGLGSGSHVDKRWSIPAALNCPTTN